MNVIMQLLQSRKNLQVGAGAVTGGLVYLVPIFIQLLGGEKTATTIQHAADAMALVAVFLGCLLAILTAIEDCARKFGVTVPPAAEQANADLTELKRRFEAMATVVQAQVPQQSTLGVSSIRFGDTVTPGGSPKSPVKE